MLSLVNLIFVFKMYAWFIKFFLITPPHTPPASKISDFHTELFRHLALSSLLLHSEASLSRTACTLRFTYSLESGCKIVCWTTFILPWQNSTVCWIVVADLKFIFTVESYLSLFEGAFSVRWRKKVFKHKGKETLWKSAGIRNTLIYSSTGKLI